MGIGDEAARCREAGAAVVATATAGDDVARFAAVLEHYAGAADLIITSGGVSAGAYEVVKDAFGRDGVLLVDIEVLGQIVGSEGTPRRGVERTGTERVDVRSLRSANSVSVAEYGSASRMPNSGHMMSMQRLDLPEPCVPQTKSVGNVPTLSMKRGFIGVAKNQALDEIAQRSVQTAVSLASQLLRREVRPQEHEALIGEAMNSLSKMN